LYVIGCNDDRCQDHGSRVLPYVECWRYGV
jgi:hypothetical protein